MTQAVHQVSIKPQSLSNKSEMLSLYDSITWSQCVSDKRYSHQLLCCG